MRSPIEKRRTDYRQVYRLWPDGGVKSQVGAAGVWPTDPSEKELLTQNFYFCCFYVVAEFW